MTASSYEIRQVATKVKDVYGEIDRRRARALGDARNASLLWKGAGSNAFSQEYERIDGEIKNLLDNLDELERRLRAIAAETDAWEALLAAQAAAAAAAETQAAAQAAATEAAAAATAAASAVISAFKPKNS
ncbi:MAG: WXG100 family type VII secretion target [Oscillospiraceae bacterium]|nr:WXG100 family type VII secretion target [Oscillospiraceae bacterium]